MNDGLSHEEDIITLSVYETNYIVSICIKCKI